MFYLGYCTVPILKLRKKTLKWHQRYNLTYQYLKIVFSVNRFVIPGPGKIPENWVILEDIAWRQCVVLYGGYSIMRQNVCEGDMFTCIDMHKNSKMRHSISPRKLDRVFANSKMRHLKCSKILK